MSQGHDSAGYAPTDIAIVGHSARLPGASTADEFWDNLRNGRESIVDLSDEDLLAAGVPPERLENPNYVKRAPLLRGVEWFDAAFFGLNPNEAAVMDPQHRLFLECGWHALEDAGYDPSRFDGPIGVFGGSGYNAYMTYHLARNRELLDSMGFFLLRHTGNDKDFLTTRLSYCLNLTGPSVNVQTACSTSLVAIHLAAQSLINFECDLALAGGVTIELPLNHGYMYSPGEIYSPDGHCRAFDADSAGTVFGSGCGMVALRRMEDALRDGDNIRAVIKGSAVNNDGAGKAGYLAPSVDGQAESIIEALEFSGVEADSITYVETHGTGTAVGDPIEVSALNAAYGSRTDRKQYCAIGSVKTNIGHLDTAAGVASIIKATLALEHRQLPPSLHYQSPNPEIDFDATPFYVNAELSDWQTPGELPRRAAVSSLGVGGTNAHIIVEQAPAAIETSSSRPNQLIVLSAKNETSLQAAGDNLIEALRDSDHRLADVAYTLQLGRQGMAHRRAVVCDSTDDLIAKLDIDDNPLIVAGQAEQGPPPVVFMFTGQGAQYVGMATDLYQQEPVFRETFDRCADLLQAMDGPDLRSLVLEADPSDAAAADRINQTQNAQPALFAMEYSLACLLMDWGISPQAMIGHSIGEYVAACLAGVFDLAAALRLVALRGELMQSAQPGSMLAVPLPADEVEPLLSDRIELGAVNSSALCVLSGDTQDIEEVAATLDQQGTPATILRTSHAFHSRSMEPILSAFEDAVRQADPKAPQRPFVSNLSGDWITDEQAIDPAYWSQHLRRTVRFARGIETLLDDGDCVFVEIGPSAVLTQMVQQHQRLNHREWIVATLMGIKATQSDSQLALRALAQLWAIGLEPDWSQFYRDETRRRVPLPGYAFNRQRYWVEPDQLEQGGTEAALAPAPSALEFSEIGWTAVSPENQQAVAGRVLVLGHSGEPLRQLRDALNSAGAEVIVAEFDEQYQERDRHCVAIRRNAQDDYERLLKFVEADDLGLVLHAGALATEASVDSALTDSFVSALLLLQAMAGSDPAKLVFLSERAYRVADETSLRPLTALLAGPGLVGALELPHLATCQLDTNGQAGEAIVTALSSLIPLIGEPGRVFALRDGQLHKRSLQPASPAGSSSVSLSAGDGCYVVTGGLSGIGYEVAKDLAANGRRRIALIGKTALPAVDNWPAWLEQHAEDDPITARVRAVQQLREGGVEVTYHAADLADQAQISTAWQQILSEHGAVNGVVHAAGMLDDGPLLTKGIEAALAVIAPKVQGTLNLVALAKDQPLNALVLFSSVSSLQGSPGQIDYVAANAFLDALANQLDEQLAAKVLTINWAAWRDVGMTERLANPVPEASAQLAHPWLDQCLYNWRGTSVYSTDLSAATHWVINEHRAAGSNQPILPGTGFLEIVKVAIEPLAAERSVALTDVMFLSPFVLHSEEPRELRVQFEPWALGTTFSVISQADAEDPESWFAHMKGRVAAQPPAKPEPLDLAAIRERCEAPAPHPNEQLKFLAFGPRWDCIKTLQMGQGEALLELELDSQFAADVDTIFAHPGMLDVATAGVLRLVPGYDSNKHFYVPIAYDRLEFHAPMPTRWISHLTYKPEASQPGDVVVFDVTVTDVEGRVLTVFEGFMLKCIEGPEALVASRPPLSARTKPLSTTLCLQPNQRLATRLEETGIAPAAGLAALRTLQETGAAGQWAISQGPLQALLDEISEGHQVSQDAAAGQASLDVSVVEDHLLGHDAVTHAAVLAKEDRFGEIKVAAFVQLDPLEPATVSELRRFVRREFEDQLVPSRFVELDEMPLAESGEIDRRQLPDPFSADDDFIAPSTETELMLTRLWQDILGVDQISITDNFFDLGGHSLLGVRLLAAIRKETGVRLEDVVVVTYTLEQISAELDKRLGEAT